MPGSVLFVLLLMAILCASEVVVLLAWRSRNPPVAWMGILGIAGAAVVLPALMAGFLYVFNADHAADPVRPGVVVSHYIVPFGLLFAVLIGGAMVALVYLTPDDANPTGDASH